MRWRVQFVRLCAGLAGLAGAVAGLAASGWEEGFGSDPLQGGWEIHGEPGLFQWDGAAGALSVSWDSSRTNSYFLRRLPTVVTERDDFSFGFELGLEQVEVGADPAKPGTFQIALGLLNVADATAEGFLRGVLFKSRNLVEWTWFGPQPDGAIAASVSPAVVPADGRLPWGYSDSFVELEAGHRYRFELGYTATNRTLAVVLTVDAEAPRTLAPVKLPPTFTGFRVDALSINSYSDAGQDPRFAGSVLAKGWVDDVVWNGPAPAVDRIEFTGTGSMGRVSTPSRPGWMYRLLASSDLEFWNEIGPEVEGTGGVIELADYRKAAFPHQFYRVEARLP